MKKRFALLLLIFLMATLFAGCALRTVADMYAIPKRSKEFKQLQVVIDQSMTGLEYSAPLSGENRQTVQLGDLNGDGQALVFSIFVTDERGITSQCITPEPLAGEKQMNMKSVILLSAANGGIYLFANIISVFKQLHLEPVLND